MNEEQATKFLVSLFGLEGATNLTELESRAIGIIISYFDLPYFLTEEEKGRAAYKLHIRNRFIDIVTARAAIDSVIYKAEKHRKSKPVSD
jgi:hypothetical protein